MTDPVQRKGPGGATGVTEGTAPEGAGAAFRAAVADAQAPTGPAAARAGEMAAIAAEIKAGTLDPSAAMERLVQRALSSATAAGLPPAQKERLAELLRAQLAEDPTLQALQRDLG
jgi:hypothetical protein